MFGTQTQTIDYEALANALVAKSKTTTKAFSGTSNYSYGHGSGGVFSYPGLSSPVFSAMALPYTGLIDNLPSQVTTETDPVFALLTGQTATSGTEPDGVCENAPQAGLLKLCMQSFRFGRRARRTPNIDLTRVGAIRNRSDFTDLKLIGNPARGTAGFPTMPGAGNPLADEYAKAAFELGVAMKRDFAREFFTGNPSNNSANGGTAYYYGLDTLINTGYRDVITGTACPAADSLIASAQNNIVNTNPTYYVQTITDMYRHLKYRAIQFGLAPAEIALVGSYGLFQALTDIWACSYMSYRCDTATAGRPIVTNSSDVEQMTREMRQGLGTPGTQYLLIDGEKVKFIVDETITETVASGVWSTQLYFVPLTVLGGTRVTYMDYFDMSAATEGARLYAPQGAIKTSDGGRYLWSFEYSNGCVAFQIVTKPRLVLRTPQIAGRLHTIRYTQQFAPRSWEVGNTYHYNGGATTLAGIPAVGSFYSPTA